MEKYKAVLRVCALTDMVCGCPICVSSNCDNRREIVVMEEVVSDGKVRLESESED